jgi:endonuclease-3
MPPREKATAIRKRFERALPAPRCELDHRNAWELLVATILSAQSTDKTVNLVTPRLFEHYPTPENLARAPSSAIEKLIVRTGFFRNKTKAIQGAARMVSERFGGEVPRTMDEMIELPGVARKTANVVLGTAYRVTTGIVVDTHVARVSQRLGLTKETKPERIEHDLQTLFPKKSWIDMGHRMVLHGRYLCIAKKPDCARCPLNELCPSAMEPPEGRWTARAERERALVESRGEVRS